MTAETIDDTPAQALDQILRRSPSVDLPTADSFQVHPTANSVSMRGLGGIRALVLLDGVPLNDPFFGYLQWSRVPLGQYRARRRPSPLSQVCAYVSSEGRNP